jgi:hypothetical protein
MTPGCGEGRPEATDVGGAPATAGAVACGGNGSVSLCISTRKRAQNHADAPARTQGNTPTLANDTL